MNLNTNKSKLPNFLFWILIVLNSYPVVFNQYFLTLDGPAHLYNAKLFLQVVFEKNNLLNYFYNANTYPEPNLTGHLLMEVLLLVFPPWLTEKTIQLIYIFGFPISFYYFLKSLNENLGFKYIYFFPFIYAFTFVIGFYNYCLSLILFFICLTIWNSICTNNSNKKLIMLGLSMLLVYFSHALVFLFCLLTIIAISLFEHFINPKKERLITTIQKIIMVSWPGLLLTITFLFHKSEANEMSYIPFNELVKWVYTLKPVVSYGNTEVLLTTILFITYILTALFKVSQRIKSKSIIQLHKTDSFFFLFIFFTILIFVIPDKLASGGFVTMRLIMFAFFFLIIWICSQKSNRWVDSLSLLFVIAIVAILNINHFKGYSITNHEVKEQQNCLQYIEPSSILLPLNYSKHWLQSNMSNYLGTHFPLLILDNYEASHKPFQLSWKKDRNPHELLGPFAGHPPLCANILNFEKNTQKKIDYILTWKMPSNLNDSCTELIKKEITHNYDTLFVSESKKLYLFQKLN